MTRSKKMFFSLVSPLAGILPLSLLRTISGRKQVIPVYHAVSNENPAHLKYLYRVKSTAEFEADLDTWLKYYTPIDLNELIRRVESGEQPRRPVFHLSFDDGLSEFYHLVAPLLEKKGIPATCFLNNSFIDNKDMMFRLKVSLLIDHLHHAAAGSHPWVAFHDWMQKYGYAKNYYRHLLMGMGYSDLPGIEELALELGLSFKDYREKHKPYLSSHQIRELIGKGFTFGAHTFDHPDLRKMEETARLDELSRSMKDLVRRFSIQQKVFSFPFTDDGIPAGFFDAARQSGLCSLSFGCAGIKKDSVPSNLQRVPVEDYPGTLKNTLKKEYIYHFFLKLIGNAVMKR